MIPLPSLNLSGGAGGEATGGNQGGATAPWAVGFGSFQVGGKGNTGEGGRATASASSLPAWLLYAGLGAAGIFVFWLLSRRRGK